ncbi:MAG: bifunctional hydroxymethylpyrimidine kinase/phosphomethylpyrimidine kinase [Bdellovibrionales bacterium]|nr:bifunctional hydroxymethylpyrimidine kinase/phosphomethylpyrimidine kinase [Bdellovibrionales bacterium]
MNPHRTPIALTIAGSDPSGGAGIQADLKVFHQHGVYGMSVITLLTVQNTVNVEQVQVLDSALVSDQLAAVLDDIPPQAAKTGALGAAPVIAAVSRAATHFRFPLVVDPVMVSTHGAALLESDAIKVVLDELLPAALLITPNMDEAALLTDRPVKDLEQMIVAAEQLRARGAQNVLIKGGHLPHEACDVLLTDELTLLPSPRIETPHTHGTGCALSAAITANLACGVPLPEAVLHAKSFISEAIETNPQLGHGRGPLNFFASGRQ